MAALRMMLASRIIDRGRLRLNGTEGVSLRRDFAVEDARVISIEMVMLAALGFLTAALLTLFLSPLYRRRVARLTTEFLKRSMPLTEAEIRADKDRLRAEYAIRIHKLEMKVEEAAEAAARQMVELNRRDAAISEPRGRRGGATLGAGGARERPPRARADDHGPAAEGGAPPGRSAQAAVPARPRDRARSPSRARSRRARSKKRRRSTPSRPTRCTGSRRRSTRALRATAKASAIRASTARWRCAPRSRRCAPRRAIRRHSLPGCSRWWRAPVRLRKPDDGVGVNGSRDAMRPAKVVAQEQELPPRARPPLKAVDDGSPRAPIRRRKPRSAASSPSIRTRRPSYRGSRRR